jgi:iron complex transport system substrate-binding protein
MMPRIVSLLPSATEIVCALGFEDALVGRSHECDFPHGVERLPVCTQPKVGGGDTRAIHASVSAILQQDISVYRVDAELLRRLQPTHVVTQIQCEVCAVSLRDVEAAMADWTGVAPRLVPLNPQSLEDVFEDIRRTAAALEADGQSLVVAMRSRMEAIAGLALKSDRKPRVATIEWLDPLMTGGNWMPSIIKMAGAVDVLGQDGKHSSWISWSDLAASDPDVILVFPCGFRMSDSLRDLHLLAGRSEWQSLRAVRAGRVYVCDGNQYFNRPGPRLVDTLEIAAEILHPEIFRFGHEGLAWTRCTD